MPEDMHEVPDGLHFDSREEQQEEQKARRESPATQKEPAASGKAKARAKSTQQYGFSLTDEASRMLLDIEFFRKGELRQKVTRSDLVNEAISLLHKKMEREKKKLEKQNV
jgi:flagellar motility protein MotE (MotC chaperone)